MGTIKVQPEPRPTDLLIPKDMPIIVLVDEGSASGSEILSGTLQYNRRGIIVGMPTVGKDAGQICAELPHERILLITMLNFSPGGIPDAWAGVIPDVTIERTSDPKLDKQLAMAKKLLKAMIKSVNETRSRHRQFLKKKRAALTAVEKRSIQLYALQTQEPGLGLVVLIVLGL